MQLLLSDQEDIRNELFVRIIIIIVYLTLIVYLSTSAFPVDFEETLSVILHYP